VKILLQKLLGSTTTAATVGSVLFASQLCLVAQTPYGANRIDPSVPTATQPEYTPITETDSLNQFLKDTASPLSLVTSAASAGIGQWKDRPREWKEGSEAYGLRYGSSYAEHIVRETLNFGAASLFHEDNRFVRSEQPGFGNRLGYALTSPFLARGDYGERRLSVSRIAAFAGAAAISRLWQPRSTNRLRSASANFGTSIGVAMGFDIAREFWPHK
jgi:hypothetical protein